MTPKDMLVAIVTGVMCALATIALIVLFALVS